MAIDNLNYYSSWLPAWQLTDKYSTLPWCLKSKNLDIFSSSKSVKATAWSEPTTTDADVIKQDGKLVLKTDWKVYERENWTDTLFIDPSTNFPVYDVCYTWPFWTYAPATRWNPQDMVVKYEWNQWKSFVVYTDRASIVYSREKFVFSKDFSSVSSDMTSEGLYADWYLFRKKENNTATTAEITIKIENGVFTNIPVRIFAREYNSDESNISLDQASYRQVTKLYYDAQLDWMTPDGQAYEAMALSWDITVDNGIELNVPITPNNTWYTLIVLRFRWTPKEWQTRKWNAWELYIDINWWPTARQVMKNADGTTSTWDCNYYYSYLPLRERKLEDIWTYGYSSSYWMKGASFQPLYKWVSSLVEKGYWNRKIVYDFMTDMWWESDPAMDVIWMITWNEQVYMIGNLDWNWYIIPCDLTWWRWTPFIAYGCEFKWVTNIDYLLYLVGNDRGVSQLWVFNQQELVSILWGTEEKDSKNIIDTTEQYRFDWKMIEYRGDLILSTDDYRIFAYWQTYGGKWWAFIHQLSWPITDVKANWKDLVVSFLYPTARPVDTYSWEPPYWDASFSVQVYSGTGASIYSYLNVWHSTTAWAILDRMNSYLWTDYTWLSLSIDWNKLDSDYPLAWTDGNPVIVYVVSDILYLKKNTTCQDDTPIRRYNAERMATYPIVLGNHLLEKEESDLYVSYILPSAVTSLEFWGMANHYHFWTFTSEDDVTLSTTADYSLKWATWDYSLKFIEKNEDQYTFRLEWDLPVQTTSEMKIIDSEWADVLSYSDYNHFRKIWEITTAQYQEWEFRFHNLNNKLELPKSHSLQIMVKGKWTADYTPELFAVDLVANQRERW